MITLQIINALVLIAIIGSMYAVAIKMLYEHRKLHNTKDNKDDQDNLDLIDKQ